MFWDQIVRLLGMYRILAIIYRIPTNQPTDQAILIRKRVRMTKMPTSECESEKRREKKRKEKEELGLNAC